MWISFFTFLNTGRYAFFNDCRLPGVDAALVSAMFFCTTQCALLDIRGFPSSIHPFIDNGRTRRPLTPIKYMDKTVSTIDSDNTKE